MSSETESKRITSEQRALFFVFLAAWILIDVFGQVHVFGLPALTANDQCFPHLGCNAGFFGYDAFDHLVVGIVEALGLVWLFRASPRLSFFGDVRWKNIVTLVIFVASAALTWEILEYGWDHFRVLVLHISLYFPNHFAQPSNADTMGDMCFTLLGAASACAGLLLRNQRIFYKENTVA